MSLSLHLVPSLAGVAPGDSVRVEGDEAHHAVAVRRTRIGEHLQLTDGAGAVVTGPVSFTGRRELEVSVEERRDDPAPTPALVVVQALPKGDRGELAVEVLTEVGVARIVPWAAARCVAAWKGERAEKGLARWRAAAREAAKQARRTWFVDVDPLASTDDVVALIRAADAAVVLHEQASAALAGVSLPEPGEPGPVVVVVSPEGGLTPGELGALAEAGALPVRLGAEVLRTSTAGVAACAALLARTPRWGQPGS